MQPHLKYAQIRPGNRTEGGGGGIIDLYRIPEFLEALTALKCSNALTAEEWKQVDAWLNQYYTWLTTSRQGRHAHTCSNNHYLFYVAQCAHLASFLGRSHEAAQWLAEAFANWTATSLRRIPARRTQTGGTLAIQRLHSSGMGIPGASCRTHGRQELPLPENTRRGFHSKSCGLSPALPRQP